MHVNFSCFHANDFVAHGVSDELRLKTASKVPPPEDDIIRLSRENMRPGDILMKVNEDGKLSHRLIIAGQKIAAPFASSKSGDANVTHSALWIKPAPTASGAPTHHAEISESRGGQSQITLNASLRHGEYRVYRPRDEELGTAAARTAAIWGENQSIRYNAKAAVRSPFYSSTFSKKAQADARQYGEDAAAANPRWGSGDVIINSL